MKALLSKIMPVLRKVKPGTWGYTIGIVVFLIAHLILLWVVGGLSENEYRAFLTLWIVLLAGSLLLGHAQVNENERLHARNIDLTVAKVRLDLENLALRQELEDR